MCSLERQRKRSQEEGERERGRVEVALLLLLMVLTMSVHSSTCFMAAVFVHIGTPPANTYAGLYDIRERPTALLLIVVMVLLGVLITMVLVAVTWRRITGKHITIYTIPDHFVHYRKLTRASLPLPLVHV